MGAGIFPQGNINIFARAIAQSSSRRVLILGQGLGSNFTSGKLEQNVQSIDYNTLFGARSQVSDMIRRFIAINTVNQLDVIAVADNGTGNPATSTITLTGNATVAGSLVFYIGAYRYRFEVGVAVGDTAATIGTNLVALINANQTIPITASGTAIVTLTTSHKGTLGNKYSISYEGSISGITVALTAFTGGSVNPVATGLLDPLNSATIPYDIIATFELSSALPTFLTNKANTANAVLEGVAILTNTDTYANQVTNIASIKNKYICYIHNPLVNISAHKGGACRDFDYAIASTIGAIRSLILTEGANITKYKLGTESVGGVGQARQPYFNLQLPNLPLIPIGLETTLSENQLLNDSGISCIGNDTSLTTVVTNQLVPTLYSSSSIDPDTAFFRFLETVDTTIFIRKIFFEYLKSQNQSASLASNTPLRVGVDMRNESSLKGQVIDCWNLLFNAPYALVSGSKEDFKNSVIVTINTSTGVATIQATATITGQLRSYVFNLTLVK